MPFNFRAPTKCHLGIRYPIIQLKGDSLQLHVNVPAQGLNRLFIAGWIVLRPIVMRHPQRMPIVTVALYWIRLCPLSV